MPTAKKLSACAARAAAFHEHRASDMLRATYLRRQDYIPNMHRAEQSIDNTLPHECGKPGPAAILMWTATSEATATAIDVEKLHATGQ